MENTIDNKNEKRLRLIQKSRAKNVVRLTKLLDKIVKTEWDIAYTANKTLDGVSSDAANSVSESAQSISQAISKLISTEFENPISEDQANNVSKMQDLKNALKD